jgi:multicomponent Na+:H+ antiporter subunit D
MIHPALVYYFSALILVFASKQVRQIIQVLLPFTALLFLLQAQTLPHAEATSYPTYFGVISFKFFSFGKINLIFAYTFILFSLFANIFALHQKKKHIHIAANLYVGSALGAVLAGDFLTLFLFWELMAITSTALVWNHRHPSSIKAMFRYLMIHLISGLCFYAGIIIMFFNKESIDIHLLKFNLSGILIFISFSINAALVPFHSWLPDAYPRSTPEGAVYLCTFTTKVAVYAFAQSFAGSELLLVLGAIAAVYGVIFALMENDIRKLLSYHIICQVGYMLIGIGMGTALAINAGIGHAIGNIFFKGLLFMVAGAILITTGRSKLSELGGLFKILPLLFFFYMMGSFAIAGLPGLNGYVTKSLLTAAAGKLHLGWVELTLMLVAVGTFMSIGLKLTYFAFFEKDNTIKRFAPLPFNTIIAMAGLSFACILLGLFPKLLYSFFEYPVKYQVFTMDHMIQTFELLIATFIGFLLIRKKLHAESHLTLDFDWFYRKGSLLFINGFCFPLKAAQESFQGFLSKKIEILNTNFASFFPKQKVSPVGLSIFWIVTASVLFLFTVFVFF